MQARALGDELVVGLISDDEIRAAKGPPVQNYEERKTLVGAVKWVDEIIDGAARARVLYRQRIVRMTGSCKMPEGNVCHRAASHCITCTSCTDSSQGGKAAEGRACGVRHGWRVHHQAAIWQHACCMLKDT
jgi:cytidyltransferase-like protein